MTVSVLIVDDHAVVRQGLQALLTSRPEVRVVGEAADGPQAVQLAQALQPDVILLDLLMPEMDGVAVMQQVRSANEQASYYDGASFSTRRCGMRPEKRFGR